MKEFSKNTHRCFVRSCENNSSVNPNITVHRFPRSAQTIIEWLNAINPVEEEGTSIGDEGPSSYHKKYVCSNHFVCSDYVYTGSNKLNRNAVPSVFNNICDSSSTTSVPTENVTQQSQQFPLHNEHNISSLSPSSPHVLLESVKRTYSASVLVSSYSNISDISLPCSSTPIQSTLSKVRCKLDLDEHSLISNTDSPEILAVPLDSATNGSLKNISFPAAKSEKKVTRKPNLLKSFGVDRISDLTPKEVKLFREVQKRTKALKRLRKKYVAKRIVFEESLCLESDTLFKQLTEGISPAAYHLLLSQLRCAKKKPKGRRWTLNEKIMSLTVLKRSPAAYHLLRQMLVLPCKRTLTTMLAGVPFKCGLDTKVLETLKKTVAAMIESDRYCSIAFDEMSLKENVQYSPHEDRILGYVDDGSCRTGELATQTMVFMVRGIRKRWKQPIACYFTRSTMKGSTLKEAIEQVIDACISIGLRVVATVCDMGANNVSALRALGVNFPDPLFTYKGHEIAVFFDPPHLLKCVRNMFESHVVRGVKVRGNLPICGAARWEHLIKMYEEDKNNSIFRLAPKLTDAHLAPTSSQRMKVSTAAQVMSHTVAATLQSFVSRDVLPVEATVTASFVADVDAIFDSFNGSERYPQSGKPLRCVLSNNSPHIQFWQDEAKSKIHNWEFCYDPTADRRLNRERTVKSPPVRPGKQRKLVSRPPSQWGWLTSINAAIHVWNVLSQAGFQYLQLRNFNQDALENLFGVIRSYCGSNFNPTTYQFTAALKTAIIINLAYKGYSGNCQADDATILSDLRTFLFGSDCSSEETVISGGVAQFCDGRDTYCKAVAKIEKSVQGGDVSVLPAAYVAGYMARKVSNYVSCQQCSQLLMGSEEDFCNAAIGFKEFSTTHSRLKYPSQKLVAFVANCEQTFEVIMASCAHSNDLLKTISSKLSKNCDFTWLKEGICQEHFETIETILVKGICEILVRWWCKRLNRQLVASKKNLKHTRKMTILTHI